MMYDECPFCPGGRLEPDARNPRHPQHTLRCKDCGEVWKPNMDEQQARAEVERWFDGARL